MKFKEFASTQKGKLIICCSVLLLVWLIILCNWLGSFFEDLPNKQKIAKINSELNQLRRTHQKALDEQEAARAVRKKYRELASKSWIDSHDGAVETGLRLRISEVAKKQDFKLNSIGSVRTSRINDDFSYADIDISGNGDFDDVIRLLAGLSEIEPKLAWRRLDLRPDNRYRRNTGTGSANLAAQVNTVPETRLNFSGTLRVFCYEGKMTVKELKITRPDAAALNMGNNEL
jgi:hypothetical protein